ncbi:MAG: HD-GYP domain-containing protein [Gaiellales bacterium]
MGTRRHALVNAAALIAVAVPALVLWRVWETEVHLSGWLHFAGVGVASAAATAAAIALTVAGALERDARAVLAGLAFSLMAALLCLHSIATPGFLTGMNGVVALTGAATLPVGCTVLAFGSLDALRSPKAITPLIALLALGAALILGLGASAIIRPSLVPTVPEAGGTPALVVLAFGLAACALLVYRAVRTYLLTHRLSDLCVAIGLVWLSFSLAASLLLAWWHLGWWVGHVLEVAGIALVGIPVARDLRLSATHRSRPLVGDLRGVDLVQSAEAFLGSQVRALLVRIAEKDVSTEEHTQRVALLAVRIGDELGLPAARLRQLALGGLLHDLGKLSVPDAILKKPAALTDAEFAVVRRHPEAGVQLLEELGAFSPTVLSLVRDHHERLDGTGYPNRLSGAELSLDVRILAACDVYDALVSSRVYREAWAPGRALTFLREGIGTQFDEKVVGALERVVGVTHGDRVVAPVRVGRVAAQPG